MKDTTIELGKSINYNNFSRHQIIESFLSVAAKHGYSCAFWQLPGSSALHIVLNISEYPEKTDVDISRLQKGFIFSPFLNPNCNASLYLKADIYYRSGMDSPDILAGEPNPERAGRAREILEDIEKSLKTKVPFSWQSIGLPDSVSASSEKGAFIKLVTKGISEIQKGKFEKVVLSRNKVISLSKDFDLAQSFASLCARYANAFVSLVVIPGTGTWMGASPETLIKTDAANIFYTDSLAGTQPLPEGLPVSDVTWTQKEIEEQALVSRYIINCFKQIRLREFEEIGPKTIIAGNLLHLKTLYKVDMEATGFPDLGTTMVKLLHPTSAVCGMPQKPALEFILENENYDRSFYSGFLGPVNVSNETHLFVNLRCMQLTKEQTILYAGAGILENSNPEKEWNETEFKCDTLIQGMNLIG